MNNTEVDLYELHWNNHAKILKGTFDLFRNDNELVDVTLSCEGKTLKAHKIVLSACSEYFLDLFRDNPCTHPIIIMTDINYEAMVNILSFMYMGEVNIAMEQLNSFLKTAESLQVKGLAVEITQGTDLSKSHNAQEKYIEVGKIKRSAVEKECHNNFKRPKISKFSKQLSELSKNTNKSDGNKEQQHFNKNHKDFNKVQIDSQREVAEQEPSLCVNEVKTEIIDLDILTDDSIEYPAFEQEFKDYSSLAVKYNGPESAGAKTYPCPKCEKVFNHYISLKLHLPRHSGDTSCGLCHAVLGRRYDLKVHMRRKHNVEVA